MPSWLHTGYISCFSSWGWIFCAWLVVYVCSRAAKMICGVWNLSEKSPNVYTCIGFYIHIFLSNINRLCESFQLFSWIRVSWSRREQSINLWVKTMIVSPLSRFCDKQVIHIHTVTRNLSEIYSSKNNALRQTNSSVWMLALI